MMIGLGPAVLILMVLFFVIPFWRILPVFGISKWVAILSFIPLVSVVLLWIIAFREPVENINVVETFG